MLPRNTSIEDRKCQVFVETQSASESGEIPKLVELLTISRTSMYQKWLNGNSFDLGRFHAGDYVLKVSLPSGISRHKVIKLTRRGCMSFYFDLRLPDVVPDMEWAYYAKPNLRQPQKSVTSLMENGNPIFTEIRVLCRSNGQWALEYILSDNRILSTIDEKGKVFQLYTNDKLYILEIRAPEQLPKYVRLPSESMVKLLIRKQVSSIPLRHPIEVIVSTHDWRMEALLQVIKTGAIKLADQLVGEVDAENMLQGKYVDANAATVGAYYLYLSGAYKKNLNWMRNLANDFPNLPDGPVIYASQLINKGNPSQEKIKRSREYFLIAANRGIPVYTMGFRMLREGLIKMCGYFGENDIDLSNAMAQIDEYHRMVDYTRDVTTLVPIKIPGSNGLLSELYYVSPGGTTKEPNDWQISSGDILIESHEPNRENIEEGAY